MSARDELGRSAIEANRNRVLRCLSNEGLMNIDEVREDILSATTTTPTPSPSPTQVGHARLAHSCAKPGQARVSWGGEHTEFAA